MTEPTIKDQEEQLPAEEPSSELEDSELEEVAGGAGNASFQQEDRPDFGGPDHPTGGR